MERPRITNAWGYQGDSMNLPVKSVESAVPFYESVMGFSVESRSSEPVASAVLERDGIRMRIVENGGDPNQDGCAFQVEDVKGIHDEFVANGLSPNASVSKMGGSLSPELKTETRDDGSKWKVFFVVAPDGLCYWFGEKQPSP